MYELQIFYPILCVVFSLSWWYHLKYKCVFKIFIGVELTYNVVLVLGISSVQSLSRVRLFATPWITARQVFLSITNSRSSLRLTYNLNQITYNYTVAVTNRFKGLDPIDRVLENYGRRFITLYRRRWSKPPPKQRNEKRQDGYLRRPYK